MESLVNIEAPIEEFKTKTNQDDTIMIRVDDAGTTLELP